MLLIVNKIKNCGENEKIEKEILDKISIPGRVLLPFYICYKYFPQQGLTTGDVSKITSELRVGIKTPNVSKAITDSLQKYLEGDSTRMRGKAVVYKLNRKGAKYFESLLNADEKSNSTTESFARCMSQRVRKISDRAVAFLYFYAVKRIVVQH